MIYPANFEEKIGFDRIREQVTALCSTPSAKAKLAEEGFSTSADEIERRLSLMNEMRSLLMLERDFPDGDYPDPAPLVAKIRVEGSYLLAAEADQLRKALVTVGAIAEFILGRGGARYPRLWELSRRVTLFPEIVRAIDAILDDRGEVKDSASPELQRFGAPSANAKGRPPSGCSRCCSAPSKPVSSMPTPCCRCVTGGR